MKVRYHGLLIFVCALAGYTCGKEFAHELNQQQTVQPSIKVDSIPDNLYEIDTIRAVIIAQEGTEIITRSDSDRPSLTGQQLTFDDLIFHRLAYLDAQKIPQLIISDSEIDDYLNTFKRDNNLTDTQLTKIFYDAGYSPQEARDQMRIFHTSKNIIDYKVRAGVTISRKQALAYWHEHPEMHETLLELQVTSISVPLEKNKQSFGKKLRAATQKYSDLKGVVWREPFTVAMHDLAQDKQFLGQLTAGQLSEPIETEKGFEVYRLITKKERTFEDAYVEIVMRLRQPKAKERLEHYKDSLRESAAIVQF